MTMSSQGCSLISHLLNSTSSYSTMCCCAGELICLWLRGRKALYSVTYTVYSRASASLFPAWGFFCAMTKPGLPLLSLRSASMTAWGDANRVLLSKTKCMRTAFFFFSFFLPYLPSHKKTLLLCHIGLCWEKVTSVTHIQSAEPPVKMNALVLSFQSCFWSLHVPVSENTLQMLRLHSYEQWYWLAWAVYCNQQHRTWGL